MRGRVLDERAPTFEDGRSLSDEQSDSPWEDAYRQALASWEAGDASSAIETLEGLVSLHPEAGPLRALLGAIYRDTKALEPALEQLEEAVRLLPESDMASRGLFHTLWDLDRAPEARDELRRFLAITDSDERRVEWAGLLAQVDLNLQSR